MDHREVFYKEFLKWEILSKIFNFEAESVSFCAFNKKGVLKPTNSHGYTEQFSQTHLVFHWSNNIVVTPIKFIG
jgi:hypothetical protein